MRAKLTVDLVTIAAEFTSQFDVLDIASYCMANKKVASVAILAAAVAINACPLLELANLASFIAQAMLSLFTNGKPFPDSTYKAPLYLRLLSGIVDIVISALPQLASGLMLIAFVKNDGIILYADMAILITSVNSLMEFTMLLGQIPDALESIKKAEVAFEHMINFDEKKRISHKPKSETTPNAVVMSNCSFNWGNDKFTIAPLSLEIKTGEFVTVVGKVGSGKTSLLSAICKEMIMSEGVGCVYGTIGYVSQKPWIMNATFRDNVLFGSEFDEKLYNQVIYACGLADDVSALSAKDDTEIGARGLNLSGGQNARLALARAIYTGADIYILDNILSAVDAAVGWHIIENVLSDTVDLADAALRSLLTVISQNTSTGAAQGMLSKFIAYTDGLEQEAPHEISSTCPPSQWPKEGKIEIRNYSMQYRPELDMSLKDLTLSIHGREKIGVVGRTGAGKSSLIYALLRIVEPANGTIIIDGIDISKIGLHNLRSSISIVPQDPTLFEGTIRENLDPECKYSDEQVWKAIQTVQIEDILSIPTGEYTPTKDIVNKADSDDIPGPWVTGVGLDKWVETDGRNFSVGQRQLLCLCRAVLWHRRILILDEATANIDSKTDQLMQTIIRSEFSDCTVITIAHRLNTIMDSDRILVMDHGKAVEFDTPETLVKSGGHYAKLLESTNLEN
ncbi:hypothetical protein H4S08_001696 [Coemansia sp. RSA 1365]|nr:hypothetical protein H4S08_001696 [Coemansia sp. RSA 1365]